MARPDQRILRGMAVAVLALVAAAVAGVAPVDAAQSPDRPTVPLELRHYVDLPDTAAGTRARIISMASTGDRLFVVEQSHGRIYEIVDRDTEPRVELWFDVGAAIEAVTDRRLDRTNAAHGGLRSLAFHPDFAHNGRFYLSLMESRPADPRGHPYLSDVADPVAADGVVVEFLASTGGARSLPATETIDPTTYREVVRIGMPVYDHPIKQIGFDPFVAPADADHGLLYVANGDGSEGSATAGGGLGDDALGKILRIDPTAVGSGSGSQSAPYSIPASNPFVGPGEPMLDAVYSLGHRNPHSLAFARQGSGSLLISAEAGRDNVEEVNLITGGANYGWSDREGTFVHRPGGGVDTGVAPLPADEWRRGLTYPAAQYRHAGQAGQEVTGESIVGGFAVDNGSALSGRYFAADFPVSGLVFQVRVAELLAARRTLATGQPPSALAPATLDPTPIRFDHDGDPATDALVLDDLAGVLERSPRWEGRRADVRFGQGPDGELYVTSKRTGEIYLVTNSLPPASTGTAPGVSPSALSPASPVAATAEATLPTTVAQALSLDDLVAAVDYRAEDGDVLRLYHAFFAREPDLAGARYWLDRSRRGSDLDDLAWGFAASREFGRRFGSVDDATFLAIVYRNVLGREPDESGRRYWLDLIEGGQLERHEVVRWVAAGAEFIRRHPYTPALQR